MILLYPFFLLLIILLFSFIPDYHKFSETEGDFGNPTWYPIGLLFCSIQPIISTGIVSSVRDHTVASSDAQCLVCVLIPKGFPPIPQSYSPNVFVFLFSFRFFLFLRFSYQALTKTDVREAVWDLRTIPGWFCRCRTKKDSQQHDDVEL